MVPTRGRLFSDSVQVFTKAPVPGEHLRHPVSRGGGAAPSNQTSQLGRTASKTLSRGAPALMSRLARHLSSRARPAKAANVLMRSPSPRQTVPGARSERRRSSDCRGSGSDISCWFRLRSQPPPTLGDSPLEASRDRSCGRITLPRTFQGTPSAPIP